jgi:hypothetical protein
LALNIIPLRWLMTTAPTSQAQATECNFLTSAQTYDFNRALSLKNIRTSDGAGTVTSLGSAGPYIIQIMTLTACLSAEDRPFELPTASSSRLV